MNKTVNNLAPFKLEQIPLGFWKSNEEICNMPMILFQINRLKKSKYINKIVIAFN